MAKDPVCGMVVDSKTTLMVTDPVCGMEVDPTKAPHTRQVMGQPFYFCSNFCAQLFDPEMTAAELVRLRAAIGGEGHQRRARPSLWGQDLTHGAIKKLLHFFGGES